MPDTLEAAPATGAAQGLDPETFAALRDTVRRFVRERLVPREAEVAESDAIPDEIVSEMRELGLFGLSVPADFGGLGLTMTEEVQVATELGWTSPAFRSVIGTNVGIGSQGLVMDGTEAQKAKYLPRIAAGELITSFALTEPEAGSDAASLRTSARRDGDHYVLNGTKRYITNAPEAGLFTVMARTGDKDSRAGGVSAFLVEANTPGVSVGNPTGRWASTARIPPMSCSRMRGCRRMRCSAGPRAKASRRR